MDKVSGLVTDILRFRGSEDRSGVLTVRDAHRVVHKVVGVTEGIEIGSYIQAEGKPHTHPVYGPQLRAQTICVELPMDRIAAEEWLSRHFDILPLAARSLLQDWYDSFLNLAAVVGKEYEMQKLWAGLNADPGRTADAVADLFARHNLSDAYQHVREYVRRKHTVDELVDLGLTSKEAQLLYSARGAEVRQEVEVDPYIAYLYVETISFKKMDDIYLTRRGTTRHDDHRVRALCLFYMRKDASDNGHTAIEYDDFIRIMEEKKDNFSATKILHNLHRLIPEFVTQYGDPVMLQLAPLAEFENGIAEWVTTGRITRDDDISDDP